MKKILIGLFLIAGAYASNAQVTPRWTPLDPSGSSLSYRNFSKTFVGYDSIAPNSFQTYYQVATLTHADTVQIRSLNARTFDQVSIEFTADTLTAGRIVTFKSTTSSPVWTTLTGNAFTVKRSKSLYIVFVFDGLTWVEESHSIQF